MILEGRSMLTVDRRFIERCMDVPDEPYPALYTGMMQTESDEWTEMRLVAYGFTCSRSKLSASVHTRPLSNHELILKKGYYRTISTYRSLEN